MTFFRRFRRLILAGALAFALLTKLTEWIAEAWFFDSLGQVAVFERMMSARIALFGLGSACSACVFAVNLRRARRVARWHRSQPARRLIPLRDKRSLDRYRLYWGGVTLVIVVMVCGAYAAQNWLPALLFFNAAPTGVRDPIFALDVAFYLFTLPALNFAWTFIYSTLWLALAATGLFYIYEEVIETAGQHWYIADEALRHLAALGAALLLWKAIGYRLSAWNVLTARGAPSGGFDWTTLHLRLPLFAVLAILAIVAAYFLQRAAGQGKVALTRRLLLLFFTANIALGALLPLGIKTLYAAPHQSSLEPPILQMRREATASASGLDSVRDWPHGAATDAQLRATASGWPMWHEIDLLRYLNTHEKRGDYVFSSLHFDAYTINGTRRPVFVAVRERLLAPDGSSVPPDNYGFGAVLCDAAKRTPDGAPLIYQLQLSHPKIVFGELPENFAVWPPPVASPTNPLPDVMTRLTGPGEAAHTLLAAEYHGNGGVPLDTSWRRLLFAWRFFDGRLLWAPGHTRVAWHRRILERCEALAPFLMFEEPHLVITDSGRLVWLINAHSIADTYPLAEALGGTRVNSLRCAAVVSVDAFDGSMTFFAADAANPKLAAYRRLFPTLFREWSEMPDDLRRHLPYPALLLSAQSDLWARFLAPSPAEQLKGERWFPAALSQRAQREPDRPLWPQCTLSTDGLMMGQLFTHPATDAMTEDEPILNGPISGMLMAKLDSGKSFQPVLWQWRPSAPMKLIEKEETSKFDSGEREFGPVFGIPGFGVPQSLLAAPVGDSLLLHYTETREGRFGYARTEQATWLITNPRLDRLDNAFVQGDTLDAALTEWWLRKENK